MRYIITLIVASIFLISCQKKTFQAESVSSEIVVKATSQLDPERVILGATFAPKKFASWMGQILLLDEDGRVQSSNTGFGAMEDVTDGPYEDLIGLSRGDEPSIFIGLTSSGGFKAYKENETGDNFDSLTLSINDQKLSRFCHSTNSVDNSIFTVLDNGRIAEQNYVVSDNKIIEFSGVTEISATSVKACSVDQNGRVFYIDNKNEIAIIENGETRKLDIPSIFDQINALSLSDKDYVLFLSGTDEGQIYVWANQELHTFTIEAGLSIDGIETPSWINTTSASMGNTFSKGLTLIGDQNSSRIVMISNEYLINQIQNHGNQ